MLGEQGGEGGGGDGSGHSREKGWILSKKLWSQARPEAGQSPQPVILVRTDTCISELTHSLPMGLGAGQISWMPCHEASLYPFWSAGF